MQLDESSALEQGRSAEGNKKWREEEAALYREQHNLFLPGALSSRTQQRGANIPVAGGAGKWQREALHHCCWDGEIQPQSRNSGEGAGIRAKEQTLWEGWSPLWPSLELKPGREGVPEPKLQLILPGCPTLTRAWVIEVTPEDQVLCAQEFLQQPKKGFISLTILIRGSVTDTKPKFPPLILIQRHSRDFL